MGLCIEFFAIHCMQDNKKRPVNRNIPQNRPLSHFNQNACNLQDAMRRFLLLHSSLTWQNTCQKFCHIRHWLGFFSNLN